MLCVAFQKFVTAVSLKVTKLALLKVGLMLSVGIHHLVHWNPNQLHSKVLVYGINNIYSRLDLRKRLLESTRKIDIVYTIHKNLVAVL